MDDSVYVAAILAHMLAVLWLCGRVVWEMLHPAEDLVKRDHGGHPDADPLAGAYAGPARGRSGRPAAVQA